MKDFKVKDAERWIDHWSKIYGQTTVFAVIFGVLLLFLAVDIWANCRLSKRAGYPGPMGVLSFIPCGAYFFWFGLAFWRWPNQKSG